jgi:CheY-like chemotaxis protein
MQCPRCRNPITTVPDSGGFLICPGCGARLTTRPARPEGAGHNPYATLPPGPSIKIPRPGEDTARSRTSRPAIGLATQIAGYAAAASPVAAPPAPASPETEAPASLETVLSEVRALRRTQDEILRLLRARDGSPEEVEDVPEETPALLPPVRSRRRKSVVIIDDDPATREASLAELQTADVPAKAFADGGAALEAMAQEKPDVIALELELGGALPGKDLVNIIKSTMELVNIPIILYTRARVESQREARQVHGADDIVLKRSGPAALVSKVVGLFRRP